MKTRKITALLLCLLLVASCLLVACDTGGDDVSAGTGSTASDGDNSGTASKYLDKDGRYWPTYSDSMRESLIGDRTEIRVLVVSNEIQTTYYSEEIEPDMYPTTDAKLNEAIEWTIDGVSLDEEKPLLAGESAKLMIEGRMKKEAGNEYQGLSIDGIGITVYATQYTHENDSYDNTYDGDATYGTGATIIGLKGTYDSLTAAAKAWRESKGVATSGGNFGMNSLDTVDSIAWVVSGEVATGDGEGVIGNNGAGQSILGGGYFTPAVTVNNITIKGVNDAKIVKTGDSYLVSAAGKNVVYENITFVDTVRIDSNPANLTFKNCKFEAGFRMPHSAANGNVTIENCTFTGNESSGYAIFAQGNMASFTISGNKISGCQRGINVQAGNNAVVTISGNTIKDITGKTDNGFTYGAAIQLTSAKTFTVTNNTISDVTVNAFHIYNGCAADSIVISDNNISAAYLCWNEANYTNVTSSGNTLNITNSGKCVTKTAEIDSDFVL